MCSHDELHINSPSGGDTQLNISLWVDNNKLRNTRRVTVKYDAAEPTLFCEQNRTRPLIFIKNVERELGARASYKTCIQTVYFYLGIQYFILWFLPIRTCEIGMSSCGLMGFPASDEFMEEGKRYIWGVETLIQRKYMAISEGLVNL